MTLRILGPKEVRDCLPMAKCIEAMRVAMALVAQNKTVQPLRQILAAQGGGMLGLMPGYTVAPEWLGAKLVTVFPANFAKGLPSHQGVVMLFDPKHGAPVAIMDAREVTAIRTAAATAVATDLLARKDVKTLALFGYGEQAREHLEALTLVRRFERVLVWGRDATKAAAFAKDHATKLLPIDAVATAEEAATRADVVCTLTAAKDPVFFGRWLKPGQHVNAVGASTPNAAEIDTDAVVRSRMFADYKESALNLGGEFVRARDAGKVTADHILGSIGDILIGKIEGRTSPADITLFKSLGMACEDLVAADTVLAEAERRNIGLVANWG